MLATQSYDTGIAAVAMLSDGKTAVIALKSSCRLRLYDTEKLQVPTASAPRLSLKADWTVRSTQRIVCANSTGQSLSNEFTI